MPRSAPDGAFVFSHAPCVYAARPVCVRGTLRACMEDAPCMHGLTVCISTHKEKPPPSNFGTKAAFFCAVAKEDGEKGNRPASGRKPALSRELKRNRAGSGERLWNIPVEKPGQIFLEKSTGQINARPTGKAQFLNTGMRVLQTFPLIPHLQLTLQELLPLTAFSRRSRVSMYRRPLAHSLRCPEFVELTLAY